MLYVCLFMTTIGITMSVGLLLMCHLARMAWLRRGVDLILSMLSSWRSCPNPSRQPEFHLCTLWLLLAFWRRSVLSISWNTYDIFVLLAPRIRSIADAITTYLRRLTKILISSTSMPMLMLDNDINLIQNCVTDNMVSNFNHAIILIMSIYFFMPDCLFLLFSSSPVLPITHIIFNFVCLELVSDFIDFFVLSILDFVVFVCSLDHFYIFIIISYFFILATILFFVILILFFRIYLYQRLIISSFLIYQVLYILILL